MDVAWMNTTPVEDKYETLDVIGNGVYGTVYQARDRETNEIVAMKRLRLDDDFGDGIPAHVIREVSLLRDFVHPNIVQLLNIQISGLSDYNLIFEYMDMDLYRKLKTHRQNDELMPMHELVKYSQQLLDGIHACHIRMIIHRDLKPQNILIGPSGLKICDFGLARICSLPIKPYTHDVVTLWYRAPEILLGAQKYGPEVDIWSAGCIIGEIAKGLPMFAGDSEIGTIFKQIQLLGSPDETNWPGLTNLENWKSTFPKWRSTKFKSVYDSRPEMGEQGLNLLSTLLSMNPTTRSTSRRAKNHPFFAHQNQLFAQQSMEPETQQGQQAPHQAPQEGLQSGPVQAQQQEQHSGQHQAPQQERQPGPAQVQQPVQPGQHQAPLQALQELQEESQSGPVQEQQPGQQPGQHQATQQIAI